MPSKPKSLGVGPSSTKTSRPHVPRGTAFTQFLLRENIGEIEGKLAAIETATHNKTLTNRNKRKLANAANNLRNNLRMSTAQASKVGLTKKDINEIAPIPLGEPFSLIKHTNGPIEHVVLLPGSTRAPQTGFAKSFTNYTLNRSNNVREGVKAGVTQVKSFVHGVGNYSNNLLSSLLLYACIFLAVLAAFSTGNIYLILTVFGAIVLYAVIYPLVKKQMTGLLRVAHHYA